MHGIALLITAVLLLAARLRVRGGWLLWVGALLLALRLALIGRTLELWEWSMGTFALGMDQASAWVDGLDATLEWVSWGPLVAWTLWSLWTWRRTGVSPMGAPRPESCPVPNAEPRA